jgi:hypothetical protein
VATEHDGDEVNTVPDTCVRGLPIYWRGREPIHVGAGDICDHVAATVDTPTEQIAKVPGEWPQKPVTDEERDEEARLMSLEARLKSLHKVEPQQVHMAVPGTTREPLFGFHDDEGRSLLEFRVRDGKVEAKYYLSDLDEAAARFLAYLFELQG